MDEVIEYLKQRIKSTAADDHITRIALSIVLVQALAVREIITREHNSALDTMRAMMNNWTGARPDILVELLMEEMENENE